MIYVSDSTNLFYLSRHAMAQLQIIDSHFPQIGAHSSISGVCINNHETNLCDCPARTNPPSRPQKLPFQPIESNIPKMKEWLLARFASSTFNKCTHQRLPMMSGPPIEIHVDPLADTLQHLFQFTGVMQLKHNWKLMSDWALSRK